MKEINVCYLPNHKNIIIPYTSNKIPLHQKIYIAWQNVVNGIERDLYLFFLTYPEKNIKIGFTKNEICEKMNMKNSSRQSAFRELQKKGYFQQIDDFDFIFIENPSFKIIDFKRNINNKKDSFPIRTIKRLLEQEKIKFEEETIFSDCRFSESNYLAYFDLFINNKYIIEYDGEQHFKPIPIWGGEEGYKKRKKHDLEKNKYCFDNNIPIIRIPYDAEYTIDDLKLETTRFLLTPENEQEYYNRS